MTFMILPPLRQLSNPPYNWLHNRMVISPFIPQEPPVYNYTEIRPQLFTDEGQRLFLKVRDNVEYRLRQAGAIRAQEAWQGCSGDSWTMMACLDRMIELGEIRELTDQTVPGQYRVFVRAREV